jgi:thiamine biosynthesis lipoprotein
VNLGGDLRIAGDTADGTPWTIGIEDERVPADHPDRIASDLVFPKSSDGAGVATSTTLKRRWAQGRRHHVIDPRTGRMSESDLVQVTVVAPTATEAEVAATTALLQRSPEAAEWLRAAGHTAVLLTAGRLITIDEGGIHG